MSVVRSQLSVVLYWRRSDIGLEASVYLTPVNPVESCKSCPRVFIATLQ
jgi:hypothetical protein